MNIKNARIVKTCVFYFIGYISQVVVLEKQDIFSDLITMGKIGDLCEIKEEMEFQWKIEDFYQLCRENEIDTCYESSKFYFSGTCWELWIYPNGETKYNTRGWIGLYLVRMSTGSPVTVDFSLGLKAVDGKTECNGTIKYEYVFNKSNGRYGYYKFISRSTLMERKSKLCPSDNLTVICSLKSSKRNADPGKLFIISIAFLGI